MIELFESVRCRVCDRPGVALCEACRAGVPIPAGHSLPAGVDRVVGGFAYDGAARSLVLDLKLRGARAAAVPLAAGAVRAVHRHGCVADTITWVPGRRSDITRRGFDHAYLIARGVGRELGLPVVAMLRRTGRRPDQTSLGRAERIANLEGAFVVPMAVRGRVAVVDDLVTTGATASASARALKMKGATSVEVISACLV